MYVLLGFQSAQPKRDAELLVEALAESPWEWQISRSDQGVTVRVENATLGQIKLQWPEGIPAPSPL